MQYEVYRHKDASDEVFKEIDSFFKQVENEDKQLCNGAQENLNSGVYVSGNLQPFDEKVCPYLLVARRFSLVTFCKGVLHFQELVKTSLFKHREKEEAEGREIWPSTRKTMKSQSLDEEIDFCSKLECGINSQLVW